MRSELVQRMDELLPRHHERPDLKFFYELLRDYPARGGKAVRSELLLLSARAHGVQEGTPAWESALWLATATELFQNWVLIHDDITDDSEERRGQPALHRQHGVNLALNAGDALHAYMWAAVARSGVPGAVDEFLSLVHRTAEGQHLDLLWVERGEWQLSERDYLEMVQLKTAYYTVVYPLRLGALCAGMVPDPGFLPAGLALGAAFQIRDDVLNLTADARYGKEIGGDLLEGKRTLIALVWLSSAPPEQRAVFLREMSKARADKDPAITAQILAWLNGSGATAHAQREAERLLDEGLHLLHRSLVGAVDKEAALELLGVVGALARRAS